MDIKQITLSKLAAACFMFNSLTRFNQSLIDFKTTNNCNIADTIRTDPASIIIWLNRWGCRHLSREYHDIAAKSVSQWYDKYENTLLNSDTTIWQISEEEIKSISRAYGSLKERRGALRLRRNEQTEVLIGPTAASKILFILMPEAIMPWDEAMRKNFGCDGSPESYTNYLSTIRQIALHLEILCKRNGFYINQLPVKLERPQSTVLELINEYLYIRVTRNIEPPSSEKLFEWASWG